MKEKGTIIAKIKENKKEHIKDADIDGEVNNKRSFLLILVILLILVAIGIIYKIIDLII